MPAHLDMISSVIDKLPASSNFNVLLLPDDSGLFKAWKVIISRNRSRSQNPSQVAVAVSRLFLMQETSFRTRSTNKEVSERPSLKKKSRTIGLGIVNGVKTSDCSEGDLGLDGYTRG